MKDLIIIFTFCAALANLCSGNPVEPASLVNLGQINGKFFFYDNTGVNWTEAANICSLQGMELAQISTGQEQEFLNSKYEQLKFHGGYWTSGVDARAPQQFVWNVTGDSMSPQLKWGAFAEVQTCVIYYAFAEPRLLSRECGATWYVLCQAT